MERTYSEGISVSNMDTGPVEVNTEIFLPGLLFLRRMRSIISPRLHDLFMSARPRLACMLMHVKVHVIFCRRSSERVRGLVERGMTPGRHLWNNEIDERELHMHRQQTISMFFPALVRHSAAPTFYSGDFVAFFSFFLLFFLRPMPLSGLLCIPQSLVGISAYRQQF